MRWRKRDRWKASIAIAGILVLMAWIPVSVVDAHERTSGLATPVTGTVQATPTEDATVTALNKEKLAQEVQQLKSQNEPTFFDWLRTNASIFLSTLIVVIGGLFGLRRWSVDRRDAQKKELDDRKAEREKRREILVQRYLYQLQDALETLWFRLGNLAERGSITSNYFMITTLYAFGKVLAIERIFALESVYPQIDAVYPGFGEHLKRHRIDLELKDFDFKQYDRFLLAEAVIVHEEDLFRASTFLEFRRWWYEPEKSVEKEWLEPAKEAIQSLPSDVKLQDLRKTLCTTANELAAMTGIDSPLVCD